MLTIYGYRWYQGIAEAIEKAFNISIPESITAFVFLLILFITILWFVCYKLILKPLIKNHKWRNKQLDETLRVYEKYTTRQQRWLYIKTRFQKDPPHDLDEPSQAQFQHYSDDPVKFRFFLNKVLKRNNNNPPYYCILGGSGMGKSTFAVNLVRKYFKKYKEKSLPYPIKLLYCGEIVEGKDTLLDNIQKIEDKANTILILDALDENNEAIDDYAKFSKNLLKLINDFRIVIITCRTQFFEKNKDEPNKLIGREPNQKGRTVFEKYYISPLNNIEINRYLNKKYLFKLHTKNKAIAVINRCPQLMARPLLLSYIDDLVGSDNANEHMSVSNIYQTIIDKWLEREAVFADTDDIEGYKRTLLSFSSDIAVHLLQSASFKSQSPQAPNSREEGINEIIERYKEKTVITEKSLKGRSLLNRNSRNEFKFAHKSFTEYLAAKQLFDGNIPLESVDCTSNDMVPRFLSYMITSTLHENDCGIDLSLSSTFSYTLIRDNKNSRMIRVSCDVSENIAKIIRGLFQYSHNIGIDCNYDYQRINEAIIKNGTNGETLFGFQLNFENYDFQDHSLVEFLKPLIPFAGHRPYVGRIEFYTNEKQVVDKGNPDIIQYLRSINAAQNTNQSEFPWKTNIAVYYLNDGNYILYPDAI